LKLKVLCIGYIPHVFTMITDHLYQAMGKPVGNTIIGLSRNLFFLIPLVLILPKFFGVYGVAAAQGCSDICSGLLIALPAYFIIMRELNKKEKDQEKNIELS